MDMAIQNEYFLTKFDNMIKKIELGQTINCWPKSNKRG